MKLLGSFSSNGKKCFLSSQVMRLSKVIDDPHFLPRMMFLSLIKTMSGNTGSKELRLMMVCLLLDHEELLQNSQGRSIVPQLSLPQIHGFCDPSLVSIENRDNFILFNSAPDNGGLQCLFSYTTKPILIKIMLLLK